ncbi:MAG: molybdopterin-dependent oxidoreductase [Campylobacterales bacterium]|nr:molybdopterin-dependent oxidoreductase [Campylobacterales bacterium]
MERTTCPLDCFDGCSVEYTAGKPLRGEKEHPVTRGYLCPHLNRWFEHPRLEKARVKGKEVPLSTALEAAVSALKDVPPHKILFYKGSGNLGLMQGVTKLFFAKHGAVIARGSLCDEGGAFGVEEGRGLNLTLSPLHVKEADVVVLWGRNPTVTNTHLLPSLKGKTVIVIDPVAIMPNAQLHLAIRPRGDVYLALLLARICYMEQLEDTAFIEARTEGFGEFKELFLWTPIRTLAQHCGLSLEDVAQMLSLMKGKKVAFLVGTGVQRYAHAHVVLRAIDSFAAMMGWLGTRGSGVGYLSDSGAGFTNPFKVTSKEASLVNVDFSAYDVVVVQGGNPASQMPLTNVVRERLGRTPCVIYLGLHENATSDLAHIVLPAKSFLEKEDLKASYGHHFLGRMPKIEDNENALSEHELCSALMDTFGYEAPASEDAYIEAFLASGAVKKEGRWENRLYETWPYENTFYTPSAKFCFLEEFDDSLDGEGMWLIFAKWPRALNSQFFTHHALHVPPTLGLEDGERIRLSSPYGTCVYEVENDPRLREDTFLLYSGANNANAITPSFESEEGHSAAYQEMHVRWERV